MGIYFESESIEFFFFYKSKHNIIQLCSLRSIHPQSLLTNSKNAFPHAHNHKSLLSVNRCPKDKALSPILPVKILRRSKR